VDSPPESTLLHRLKDAAGERPKLYHATRVLLRVRPSLPADGSMPPRWWSGVDPAGEWEEFLGANVEVFEAREYERRSRWQQSCYYGDATRLNEYTVLAREAWNHLPASFAIPRDDSGTPHIDRDVWTMALYRVAMHARSAFALDTSGLPPYADLVFPGLEHVIACTLDDRDREEPMLERFRKSYRKALGRLPNFLFATLRLDVFAASIQGLEYLIEHAEELYGDPDAVTALVNAPESREVDIPAAPAESGSSQAVVRSRKRAKGQNEERDRWIYDRCLAGESYKSIVNALNQQSEEWGEIVSPQGIYQAAKHYAERHDLDLPPSRKRP